MNFFRRHFEIGGRLVRGLLVYLWRERSGPVGNSEHFSDLISDRLTAYFKMAASKRKFKLSFIHYFPMGCKSPHWDAGRVDMLVFTCCIQFDFHLIENVALEKTRILQQEIALVLIHLFCEPNLAAIPLTFLKPQFFALV